MKSIAAALVAIAIVSGTAAVVLGSVQESTAERFTIGDTRP
jgi:type II secretory pathway pseudopilin PulG